MDSFKMPHDESRKIDVLREEVQALRAEVKNALQENRWLAAQIKVKDNTITYMNSLLDEEVINEPK